MARIFRLVSKEKNEALMQEISFKEVEKVVVSMLRNKSPSPNRLTLEL